MVSNSNVRTRLAEMSEDKKEITLGKAPRLYLESDQIKKLCRLLRDFDFIEEKIIHPQLGLQELINDYEFINDPKFLNHPDYNFEKVKVIKLIASTLTKSAHILAEDKMQMATQLWGRLKDCQITEIQELLEQAEQSQIYSRRPWLRPLSSSLIPPGSRLQRVITGHSACVNTVIVTSDGGLIISGADDGMINVWDSQTGKKQFYLPSHSAVTTLAVTPDSKRLISSSIDGIVTVWDLEKQKELPFPSKRDDSVKVIAITPDGKKVILYVKGRIREIPILNKFILEIIPKILDLGTVWNLETIISSAKRIIRKIYNLQEIYSEIIHQTRDKGTVWNLETKKKEFTFKASYPVTSIAVTPNGKLMILGCVGNSPERASAPSGTIIVQNVETGEKLFTLNSSNIITAIAITPDGKLMISGSINGTLTIWNLKTMREKFTLTGHSEEVTAIAITPNGKLMISGSKDNTLKIWSLENEDEQFNTEDEQFNTHNHNNQINPNLSKKNVLRRLINYFFILTKYIYRTLKFTTYIILYIIYVILGIILTPLIPILLLLLFTISNWIYLLIKTISTIKKLIGFDVTYFVKKIEAQKQGFPFTSHRGLVNALTITPDGKQAISISDYKTLKVWDLEKREERFALTDFRNLVNTIVSDRNSKQLLFTSSDKTIKMCNLEGTNKIKKGTNKILTFRSHSQKFCDALRLSVCLFSIFSGINYINPTNIINPIIWGFLIHVFFSLIDKIELDYANTVVVTPDSEYLISGSRDNTIKVWNLQSRRQIFTLRGHNDWVTALAVTPASKYLISGSRDKTIKIWNLQTRKEIFTLRGHNDWVTALAVTPDSEYLISGSRDKTIKIWNLQTRKEITIKAHSDSVKSVVVTPDGKYFISASSDSIKVWNLESREVIASFTGDSALCCCAVAPDGVTIVASDALGQVHFLRLEGVEA